MEGKNGWRTLSTAYVGYEYLMCEKQFEKLKVVNTLLISKVAVVNIWPTSARITPRRDDVNYNRGSVCVLLYSWDSWTPEEQRTRRESSWLSTCLPGLDFLELILINTLGFEFKESYAWMLDYANNPTNSSTKTIEMKVKTRPDIAIVESLYQEQVKRQIFRDKADQRRITERYDYV